jgi:hypothetical protein
MGSSQLDFVVIAVKLNDMTELNLSTLLIWSSKQLLRSNNLCPGVAALVESKIKYKTFGFSLS